MINYPDLNSMYIGMLKSVSEAPDYIGNSRNGPMYEKLYVQVGLTNPLECQMTVAGRGFNQQYAVIEKMEYLYGRIDFPRMLFYNKHMTTWANEHGYMDDSYGDRFNYWLTYIYHELQNENSRRAVLPLYGMQDRHESKAIPCPLALIFVLRDGILDLNVKMRSNDLYMGFPYDVESFCFIQEVMAVWLGAKVGRYVHEVTSMHIYKEHLDKLSPMLGTKVEFISRHKPIWDLDYEDTKRYMPLFMAAEQEGRKGNLLKAEMLTKMLPLVLQEYIQVLAKKWEKIQS